MIYIKGGIVCNFFFYARFIKILVFLVKIRVAVWNMEGLYIGDHLYGTEFRLSGSVDGRNDGKCLLL